MSNHQGFTLIELLIVIAIIAILASVVFVALNPLQRFQDARNAARWTDVTALLSAAKISQVDNGGSYINAISGLTAGTKYLIGTASGVNCVNTNCSLVTAGNCVDLTPLVTAGYLGRMPVSPNGVGNWSEALTGYYLSRNANNSLTVSACETENNATISANR